MSEWWERQSLMGSVMSLSIRALTPWADGDDDDGCCAESRCFELQGRMNSAITPAELSRETRDRDECGIERSPG